MSSQRVYCQCSRSLIDCPPAGKLSPAIVVPLKAPNDEDSRLPRALGYAIWTCAGHDARAPERPFVLSATGTKYDEEWKQDRRREHPQPSLCDINGEEVNPLLERTRALPDAGEVATAPKRIVTVAMQRWQMPKSSCNFCPFPDILLRYSIAQQTRIVGVVWGFLAVVGQGLPGNPETTLVHTHRPT